MRLAQRVLLLTAMALAAMAVASGTALAQEEAVEVVNEASLEHCVLSNCEIHIEGVSVYTLHVFGSESQNSACTDEFFARIGEDGNGVIHTYVNDAASSATCSRIQCNDFGEEDWDLTGFGEYLGTDGEGHVTLRMCLDEENNPGAAGRHCTVELDFHDHPHHKYELEAVSEECPIVGMTIWIAMDGRWESEATPGVDEDDIEIVHAP